MDIEKKTTITTTTERPEPKTQTTTTTTTTKQVARPREVTEVVIEEKD